MFDIEKVKQEVQPHDVPIWSKPIDPQELKYMDKKVNLVIQNIDGVAFIKKIAYKIELDINFVIYVIHNLIMIDSVFLIDIFQFNNIYRATQEMKNCKNVIADEFNDFCVINQSHEKSKNTHEICSHYVKLFI